MKKTFLQLYVFLMVLISVSSCTKSANNTASNNPSNSFYLRFKSNGAQIEYKANAAGNFNKALSGATEYIATLGGTEEQFEAKKSNMTIALTTIGTNSTNITYTNYSTQAAGFKKPKLLQLGFFDKNGKFYMSWADEFATLLPPGSPINCRLVVTEATSAYIKGNFSGTLFSQDYINKLDITEGEFYLKRVN